MEKLEIVPLVRASFLGLDLDDDVSSLRFGHDDNAPIISINNAIFNHASISIALSSIAMDWPFINNQYRSIQTSLCM